jgi:hypothetical protein
MKKKNIPILVLNEDTVGNPPSGYSFIIVKTNGQTVRRDSNGDETVLGVDNITVEQTINDNTTTAVEMVADKATGSVWSVKGKLTRGTVHDMISVDLVYDPDADDVNVVNPYTGGLAGVSVPVSGGQVSGDAIQLNLEVDDDNTTNVDIDLVVTKII